MTPSNSDEDIDLMLNDDFVKGFEERRLNQWKAQRSFKEDSCSYSSDEEAIGDYVDYTTVYDASGDADILAWTTSSSEKNGIVIVHFYHPDYSTSKVVDEHLANLAKRFPRVKCCRVSVLSCPFLVAKFKIQMLPYIAIFKNGFKVDQVIGFDELGGSTNFGLETFIERINKSFVLFNSAKKKLRESGYIRRI
jgi:hypothetical protein